MWGEQSGLQRQRVVGSVRRLRNAYSPFSLQRPLPPQQVYARDGSRRAQGVAKGLPCVTCQPVYTWDTSRPDTGIQVIAS